MIKRSIEFLIPPSPSKPRIEVQFFSKKKQFKAFVEIDEPDVAKEFFSATFASKMLNILDMDFNVTMSREMRAYLVKTEEQFTLLAMQRYQEEMCQITVKTIEDRPDRK